MQEEAKKNDDLIDVGDADESATEINLDEQQPKEEAAKEEEKVEVEQVEAKEEKPVEEKSEEKKDELKEYSEGVQKRIAKLTRKMREAERQKEEAIAYAESIKKDKETVEGRLSKLDKTYVSEFESRVKTNLAAAKLALKTAIESQDIEAQVAAQEQIANLTMDAARLSSMKNREEAPKKEVNINPQRANTTAPTDPKAEDWAANNSWFGNDSAMTYTAFDIHKKLVEEEGYDPKTDEYYTEVDKRIRLEFPHKFDNKDQTSEKPTQNVASVKRSTVRPGRRTVRLTSSQVAIAKKLGVPLEEYAKQLKITKEV